MRVIHEKAGITKCWVEDHVVHVHWDDLSDDDVIRESCLLQAEEVRKGAKVVLIDTADATGVPSQETQAWFGSTLFPIFKEHQLKALITVVPTSALSKLASNRWSRTGAPFGFEIYDAESVAAAETLAAKFA